MTTLNGLSSSWEYFIQGICARRRLTKFSRIWEEFTQEEARLVTREENIGDDDNKSLTTHSKKRKNKKEEHSYKNKRFQKKDVSQLICFTCDEKGHFAKYCPKKKGKKKRHHTQNT